MKLAAAPVAAAVPAGAVAKVIRVTEPAVASADLKKRELVDLVTERSGMKKKDVKPVVETMLAVLGDTLSAGRELNLSPLGKLRINRSEDKDGHRIIVCKLRQKITPEPPKDPLAEAAE